MNSQQNSPSAQSARSPWASPFQHRGASPDQHPSNDYPSAWRGGRCIATIQLLSLLIAIATLVVGCDTSDLTNQQNTERARPSTSDDSSAWPEQDLAAFIFRNLDLSTFRNSTGPKRTDETSFPELGISMTSATPDIAEHNGPDWLYRLEILRRQDFNGDGYEEVAVCFSDFAQNGGSYATRTPLTLINRNGRVIAIDFEVSSHNRNHLCSKYRG